MAHRPSLFKSFLQGGFECSTHRRFDHERLDLIAQTGHDQYALQDYQALRTHGIKTVRDGLRWHLIESTPRQYDWTSFLPMLHAAREAGVQVIWDLCHYGWPDDIDIWKPEFIDRFANFALNVANVIKNETDDIPFYTPINEISFWSWAGGDVAYFNPSQRGRGFELKHQLVRAAIAAINAVRSVDSRARFVQAEPLIHVLSLTPTNPAEAEQYNNAQYQTFDMLAGHIWPGLGGGPEFLDIIGLNYYPYNQWYLHGPKISRDHPEYLRVADMLVKVHERYARPMLIAETGTEGFERMDWLSYICDEARLALFRNVCLEGICLYPVTNYPGWDDSRHCETGLLEYVDLAKKIRPVYQPLAAEIIRQQSKFSLYL